MTLLTYPAIKHNFDFNGVLWDFLFRPENGMLGGSVVEYVAFRDRVHMAPPWLSPLPLGARCYSGHCSKPPGQEQYILPCGK